MNWLVQTGLNPWNEEILTHAQWNLVYAALAFGALFMLATRSTWRSGRSRKVGIPRQ